MSTIALPLVGLGFLLMFSKKTKTEQWGKFIVGFAILFIGLDFLKSAVPDIKNNPDILNWLSYYTDLGYFFRFHIFDYWNDIDYRYSIL